MEAEVLTTERTVRLLEITREELFEGRDLIGEMYNDDLDVVLIRGAFDRDALQAVGTVVSSEGFSSEWRHPNPPEMMGEDIKVLGVPLTPSGSRPAGPDEDDYFISNPPLRSNIDDLFGSSFDANASFKEVLSQLAAGKPSLTPRDPIGKPFAPYTMRQLSDGEGIAVHHDYHFGLRIYNWLCQLADTSLALSYFTPVSTSKEGGALVVYALTLANPNKPMLENGRWDAEKIREQFDYVTLHPEVGDLVVFASGRCLHQVTQIVGETPRTTLGGFLALDGAHERVLFWS